MSGPVVRQGRRPLPARVRLFLTDVDGVLTDGGSSTTPRCRDETVPRAGRHGIKMLQRAGVAVGIITGRTSEVVAIRARELGIDIVRQGEFDKVAAWGEILAGTGILPPRPPTRGRHRGPPAAPDRRVLGGALGRGTVRPRGGALRRIAARRARRGAGDRRIPPPFARFVGFGDREILFEGGGTMTLRLLPWAAIALLVLALAFRSALPTNVVAVPTGTPGQESAGGGRRSGWGRGRAGTPRRRFVEPARRGERGLRVR